jgi:hypothetical protein
MTDDRPRTTDCSITYLSSVVRPLPSDRRYTQTRAGGRFSQMRSEASAEKPPSRRGNGEATE